jgi:hypothetical protein
MSCSPIETSVVLADKKGLRVRGENIMRKYLFSFSLVIDLRRS